MKGRRILVFGAAGFIGTYLIDELLSSGYVVTASDVGDLGTEHYQNRGVPYVEIDITKENDFERLEGRFDAVVHLAACQPANVGKAKYSSKDYVNVNVLGTLNILDFCKRNEVPKILYASSHRNTQGLWRTKAVIREDDGRALKFDGEYTMFSISESAAQDCVHHYQAQHGLQGIILRLPPVYGYGPHTEIFKDGEPIKTGFQIFIEKAKECEPLEIWGDGSIGRDIVYVKDVVSAVLKGIENDHASGLFNIGSGRFLTLREQAETTAKVFWCSDAPPRFVERPEKTNGLDSFRYDITKAERELGWSPKYSFEDMLIDYKAEEKSGRYAHLIEKRRRILDEG